MPDITLTAETGRPTGSRASNRLRREGKVPGVLYGHGRVPLSLAVDRRALRHALTGAAGVNAVVTLQVDGQTHPTIVKSLQRDPVRRAVTHVDFIVVSMTEEITLDVPVVITGEPKRVLQDGGVIEQSMMTLSVVTTPANIPDDISVDVSDLDVGDVVRVGDLKLPAGVTTTLDEETPVVIAARGEDIAAEDAEAAAEAAEGEEGEAAAEGAASEATGEAGGAGSSE